MTLQKATSVIKDTLLNGGDLFGRQYETARKTLRKSAGLTEKSGSFVKNASYRLYCKLIECENLADKAHKKHGWR